MWKHIVISTARSRLRPALARATLQARPHPDWPREYNALCRLDRGAELGATCRGSIRISRPRNTTRTADRRSDAAAGRGAQLVADADTQSAAGASPRG